MTLQCCLWKDTEQKGRVPDIRREWPELDSQNGSRLTLGRWPGVCFIFTVMKDCHSVLGALQSFTGLCDCGLLGRPPGPMWGRPRASPGSDPWTCDTSLLTLQPAYPTQWLPGREGERGVVWGQRGSYWGPTSGQDDGPGDPAQRPSRPYRGLRSSPCL